MSHRPFSHRLPWSGWLLRTFMSGEIEWHVGLPIHCRGVEPDLRRPLLGRVTAALDELHRFEPRRIDRLVRDGVAIVIVMLEGRNFYSEQVNAICLDRRILVRETMTTSTIACTIVHESVHARFAHAGLYYNQRCAARMERRCVEEEIAYVGRSPFVKPDELAKWAALKRGDLARPWWTPRARTLAFAKVLDSEGHAWLARYLRFRARFLKT